jgi:hypothetical protein
MNIEDHVRGVKMYGGIRMECKVIEQLFAFFMVESVPFDCLLAMEFKAMSTVRSTARA